MQNLKEVYHLLLTAFGSQKWWPAANAYEMMVGAILTQNTRWSNVEMALANLGENLKPEFIDTVPLAELALIIRPSGFYQQKAHYLKALTFWFKKYNYDLVQAKKREGVVLRQELLEVRGIGPETADSILTYALDKPFFVVDTYTKRILTRLGYQLPHNYEALRLLIEKNLPRDLQLYQEFHALLVEQAKRHCARKPLCTACPLARFCVE